MNNQYSLLTSGLFSERSDEDTQTTNTSENEENLNPLDVEVALIGNVPKKSVKKAWYFVDDKLLSDSPTVVPDGIEIIIESRTYKYVMIEDAEREVVTYFVRNKRQNEQRRLDLGRILPQNTPEALPQDSLMNDLETLSKCFPDIFLGEITPNYLTSAQEETLPLEYHTSTLEDERFETTSELIPEASVDDYLLIPKFSNDHEKEDHETGENRTKRTRRKKWYFVDDHLLSDSPTVVPDGIEIFNDNNRNFNYVIDREIQHQVVSYFARDARKRRHRRLNDSKNILNTLVQSYPDIFQEGVPPENEYLPTTNARVKRRRVEEEVAPEEKIRIFLDRNRVFYDKDENELDKKTIDECDMSVKGTKRGIRFYYKGHLLISGESLCRRKKRRDQQVEARTAESQLPIGAILSVDHFPTISDQEKGLLETLCQMYFDGHTIAQENEIVEQYLTQIQEEVSQNDPIIEMQEEVSQNDPTIEMQEEVSQNDPIIEMQEEVSQNDPIIEMQNEIIFWSGQGGSFNPLMFTPAPLKEPNIENITSKKITNFFNK